MLWVTPYYDSSFLILMELSLYSYGLVTLICLSLSMLLICLSPSMLMIAVCGSRGSWYFAGRVHRYRLIPFGSEVHNISPDISSILLALYLSVRRYNIWQTSRQSFWPYALRSRLIIFHRTML